MIPLRLELSEKTALRVQDAPQVLKDAIEERHNLLLSQVRQLYLEKQKELEQYVDLTIDDYEATQVHKEESKERVILSSPRIKSIVKRSPSNSEKRVSFSSSPPKVELFKKDYFEEEDDSSDERRPPVTAPNGEAVNFRSKRSGPYYPFPQLSKDSKGSTPAQDKPIPTSSLSYTTPAFSYSDGDDARSSAVTSSEEGSPTQTHHPEIMVSPSDDDTHPSLNIPAQESKSLEGAAQTGNLKKTYSQEEMFPFEDMLEPPNVENDEGSTVTDHHAPFDESDSKADEMLPDPEPVYHEPTEKQMIVGSAPIDITSRPRRVEGDGGPAALGEADRRQQEAEDVDLSGSVNRIDIQDPAHTDPSQMSFSQRMEWENIRGLRTQQPSNR